MRGIAHGRKGCPWITIAALRNSIWSSLPVWACCMISSNSSGSTSLDISKMGETARDQAGNLFVAERVVPVEHSGRRFARADTDASNFSLHVCIFFRDFWILQISSCIIRSSISDSVYNEAKTDQPRYQQHHHHERSNELNEGKYRLAMQLSISTSSLRLIKVVCDMPPLLDIRITVPPGPSSSRQAAETVSQSFFVAHTNVKESKNFRFSMCSREESLLCTLWSRPYTRAFLRTGLSLLKRIAAYIKRPLSFPIMP